MADSPRIDDFLKGNRCGRSRDEILQFARAEEARGRQHVDAYFKLARARIAELEVKLAEAQKDAERYQLPWSPGETARRFHEAYEQFAPAFGYVTRLDTRAFDPDSANGALMIAVVRNVLIEQAALKAKEGA